MSRLKHVAADAVISAGAFSLAYLLRFDFALPDAEMVAAAHQLGIVVALQVGMMASFGVYRFIWRYIGLREVRTIGLALLTATLPLLVVRFTLPDGLAPWRVPISVIVMTMVFMFSAALAMRAGRRVIYESYQQPRQPHVGDGGGPKAVLLIGAGRAGKAAAEEIRRVRRADLLLKGFIDDSPAKQGSVIHGLKVLGSTNDLATLVAELDIDHVVIAMAHASRQNIRRIVSMCEQIPVKARIIPSLPELLEGSVSVSRIRDVRIDDLLGRAPIQLDQAAARGVLSGKTVMVTGAGGSIGSELARQVIRHAPARLLLAERAEFALFNIHHELQRAYPDAEIVPVLVDVGVRDRVARVFAAYAPQVVIHAAAHKHVPLMEAAPAEAVTNNSCATRTLGELAAEAGVEVFVLISTDKAVRPTSVMGASKRLAELVIQDLDARHATRFVGVRFGNVIGSSGSVIPIFRAQIEKGGPVTVTHPDMVRYFMTIPEAAQLVLEAAAIGQGGEIFVLDMGEPVKILELAKDLISLAGLRPFIDIEIAFSGTRPGEKLFEELDMSDEQIAKTRHPKIFIGKISGLPPGQVNDALRRLERAVAIGDDALIKRILQDVIPEASLTLPVCPDPQRESWPAAVAAHVQV